MTLMFLQQLDQGLLKIILMEAGLLSVIEDQGFKPRSLSFWTLYRSSMVGRPWRHWWKGNKATNMKAVAELGWLLRPSLIADLWTSSIIGAYSRGVKKRGGFWNSRSNSPEAKHTWMAEWLIDAILFPPHFLTAEQLSVLLEYMQKSCLCTLLAQYEMDV